MKKLLGLVFVFLAFVTFSFANIYQYFSSEEIKKINSILEKFDKKIKSIYKNSPDKAYEKYFTIFQKIEAYKEKYSYEPKILALLDYLHNKIYQQANENFSYFFTINDKYMSKDSIIPSIPKTLYWNFAFRIKSLYGPSLIKNLVFQNNYPDQIPYLKNFYIFSSTGIWLGMGKWNLNFVNIEFIKPYQIQRNQETLFIIRFSTDQIQNFTQTNKKLKLNLVDEYAGIKTHILNPYTWDPYNYTTKYLDNKVFILRKSIPYIYNQSKHTTLVPGDNKIFEFKIKALPSYTILYKIKLDLILDNVEVNTWDYSLYINWKKYENAIIYAENKSGQTTLNIIFPGFYWLSSDYNKFEIYAQNVKILNYNNAIIATQWIEKGDTTDPVQWNYNWNRSIIWTDWSDIYYPSIDKQIWFTDKRININTKTQILEKD